ncbi:TRAP transporter large permease [Clostridium sp. AM58-1XD]|uniref:TRAP transporter large permease n=1 Tax=Clostridium sp. AM58-1XD TaxID=2292307 RepID=UPI000E4C00B4|nr:TRAP transporter large permease [Clostridium sp. AM58-1XD]RGY97630.1 TRAP transporter large permease [Clostridium sp. AM58-1XD]
MNPITLLLLVFVSLLIINVPIAVSIGMSMIVYAMATGGITLTFLAKNMYTTCDSFPLMAVPFFILAGAVMEGGGLSKRLVDFCESLVGHFTGGLAIVSVITCMFFGAISGSSPATVAAIGAIMIPSMVEKGYDKKFAVALVAAAGMLGVIIPPSIPMVMYGIAANASIGGVFLGGISAGLICGLSLIVVAVYYCRKNGYSGNGESFSLRKVWITFKNAIWALLVPVIILGGIYGGIFTPTEAASVAVVYGFIAGVFIYKELDIRNLFTKALSESAVTVGSVLILVSTATILSKVFVLEGVPQRMAMFINSISDNIYVIMILINLLLLVVGCVMETAAAILILAPILYPIVQAYGIGPIHFGVMMVVNLAIGMLTPPVGVNLFVATGIGQIQFVDLVKKILPFIAVLMIALAIIIFIPAVTEFLPTLLGY